MVKDEKEDLKMKIVIIGSRGIPAKYGGFETFAQGLTENLEDKKYEITVSCEYKAKKSRENSFNGSKLEYFPIKPPKHYLLRKFYENLSDIYFLLKLSRRNEIIYFLGTEVGMFLFIPKLLNRKSTVLVNIDGVMWERSKFNQLERWLLKLNHDLATKFADKIIADAEAMKNYVNKKYWNKTLYLPYGIENTDRIPWNKKHLKRLKNHYSMNITPGKYFLVIARLEPENNIHTIVNAFSKAEINIPLVIVGDFTSTNYKEQVEALAETCMKPGVIFLGSIYDQDLLNMLRQNCIAYLHGHSVGGTNPSLLEAAISSNIIIAHDNQFNSEVCGKSAVYFVNETELARKMKLVYRYNENYLYLKNNLYYRVKKQYLWDKITAEYHSLFQRIYEGIEDIKLPEKDVKLIPKDNALNTEDSKGPLVSVIIPVYNSQKTIGKCLESIENQSYLNIETLVIESKKSDDGTIDEAKKFNCQTFCLSNQERTAATNFGIDMAKGKYIYRVDSDVILDKDLVEEAVQMCEIDGFDAVSVLWSPDPQISFWAKVRKLEKDCYKYDTIHSGARFFRKDISKVIGKFNEEMVLGEDYDFHNRLIEADFKLGILKPQEVHLGEPKTMKEIVEKQYYYGKTLQNFLKEHKSRGVVQMLPVRRSLIVNWKKFAKNPVLTLGFFLYEFVYYSSSIAGFLVSIVTKNE